MSTTKALEGVGGFLDDRFRGAKGFRTFFKKIFPDHWTFLLGEIALYSFIILLLSGTFLTFWFQPSMTQVVYHGSYTHLDGVRMSEAYASTLHISFDVRGGLLMRQIHHWAADLFMAAIFAHMLRIFFTGAYRKPREVNWLIGIVLLTLGLLEGLFGYSLPDDLLSGAGLRITEGVMQSIPVVGTYLAYFLFGGPFPGNVIIPRLYILHVLLIPGLILALVTAHLFIMFHQKHTQMPGKGRTEQNVVGAPMYPYFMAKTGAFFFFTFAALALAATFAQINPVWLYGPYTPVAMSAGSQPDFYMGMLEGALRVMVPWEWNVAGHTFSFNVFVPALLPLGAVFTGAAMWPFLERWVTGDKRDHHVNDRPRNAPTRTGIGVAVMTFYGVLWLEGANDLLAEHLDIALYTTTRIAQVSMFVAPVIAYILTKRICLGLQRKDLHLLEHGVETGVIRQLPSGEFTEIARPLTESERAKLVARTQLRGPAELEATDENGIPAPASRHAIGRVRARLNTILTESVDLTATNGHGNGHGGNGHGNGHGGNGHGAGEPAPAAVPAGGPQEISAGAGPAGLAGAGPADSPAGGISEGGGAGTDGEIDGHDGSGHDGPGQ
jgi:quinol---cytochrome-c reductase cytochrome b subunit